ncbi:MAG: hypothetical protein EXS25_08170 [Pedosphaera sp.]|nr:hypothetical protein [Pedosphaera sp.]
MIRNLPLLTASLLAMAFLQPLLAKSAIVKVDRGNVRTTPSRDGEVIATLRRGDSVDVREAANGEWVRIALPAKASVWIYGLLVDIAGHQVRTAEANVRTGPGKNYSELGKLKKGDTLVVLRESDGWLQIEAPSSISCYISAGLLSGIEETTAVPAILKGGILPPEPSLAETLPPPLSQTKLSVDVPKSIPLSATNLAPLPSLPIAEPISAPPIKSSLQAEAPHPKTVSEVGQALIEYTEKVRMVERVGKVRLNLNPQSPSYYELDSLKAGEGQLGYLNSDDASIQFKGFRGKTVRVIAEEYISKPPASRVILKVRSIELEAVR